MMSIPNLGSKQNVGNKFKEGICTKLCLKLWFDSNWYFVKLLTRDDFESESPERIC